MTQNDYWQNYVEQKQNKKIEAQVLSVAVEDVYARVHDVHRTLVPDDGFQQEKFGIPKKDLIAARVACAKQRDEGRTERPQTWEGRQPTSKP